MGKFIKVTPEIREEIIKSFTEEVAKLKSGDGKLTYTKDIGTNDRKALLLFTELAYTKVTTLVNNWSDEIAWHCLAKRGEDPEKDEYIIYDVIIYPQEVTGSTVTTDQEKYQSWLYQQPDEVFNNIRCQSHSHVNMGVSPSSVDNHLYDEILAQLTDDMFYIFTIHNKKGDMFVKIYDLQKNLLFTGKDVEWNIIEDGSGFLDLIEDAKKKVTKHVTTYTGYGRGYNGYVGSAGGNVKPATQTTGKTGTGTSVAVASTTKDKEQKGVPKKNAKKSTYNPLYQKYDDYDTEWDNNYMGGYYY